MSEVSQTTYVLITGASAGLGAEYAKQLAGKFRLLLIARREDRLEKLAEELREKHQLPQEAIIVQRCDLSLREERNSLINWISTSKLEISGLINNAGFGSLGKFSTSDYEWEEQMVRLNCIAPLHLSHSLNQQLSAHRGFIVNICSTAAFQPMPYMATYGATKAFLLSFSMALRSEVLSKGVRVIAHCPGPTDTEFHLVVGLKDKLSFLPAISAEEVVSQATEMIENSRSGVKIHGNLNRLLASLNRLLPIRLSSHLVERVLRGSANKVNIK